jgi:hypothetical protein
LVQCRVEHMDRLCHCVPYFYYTGGRQDVANGLQHRRSLLLVAATLVDVGVEPHLGLIVM